MDGNTQFGGRCLDLISFPEYPYYPQTILIEAYDPAASYAFKQKKYIKIKDCDHDDPSCHDYYNQSEAKLSSVHAANCDEKANRVRVFDLYGRLLYEGEEGGWLKSNQNYGGLAIIQYFYPCKLF